MRLLFVGLLYLVSTPTQLSSSRTMAITIDDLPTASVLGNDIARAEKTTRDLLAAIKRANVPAIGFVNVGRSRRPAKRIPGALRSSSSGSTRGSSLATTPTRIPICIAQS